jgi:hypothetical protein
MLARLGSSLTTLTVIETVAAADVARLSLAVNVKLSGPLKSPSGV